MPIPPDNTEIERIYAQVMASGVRSLAICAANPNEGVSSLALALAQRNLLSGEPTLLVDLNLHKPILKNLLELDEAPQADTLLLPQPQLVCGSESSVVVMGVTAPTQRDAVMRLRKPGALETCIEKFKKDYQMVVFDTTAINRVNAKNIPAETIAAACDACILVVLSGQTTEQMVALASQRLQTANASLIGCVLNDQHTPSIRYELHREIQRLRPNFNTLANWLEKKVAASKLLNTEV